jgi:dTDP-4-dehydrorhamnose 3,5-epimerase
MSFSFERLEIPDVIQITPTRYGDQRGFFSETYRESAFREGGVPDTFVQDNHARSTRGVLRGLHFQEAPRAQAKLVRVVHGEVFDVAVDLRVGSPTFGSWVGGMLSGEGGEILYIPGGFAHGYLCLSETADLVYKVSAEFDASLDAGIAWNDPSVGIEWPLDDPILSERDLGLPLLRDVISSFRYEQ